MEQSQTFLFPLKACGFFFSKKSEMVVASMEARCFLYTLLDDGCFD